MLKIIIAYGITVKYKWIIICLLKVAYMRKIDGSSNYLKNQIRKYLSRAMLSLLLGVFIFALTCYYHIVFQTQTISVIDAIGFVTSIVGLLIFRYYQHKYHVYKGGQQGEKIVIKTLANDLNDDYCLISGVYLRGGGGDIDHVVLGPTGVYVLETKNWSGKIVCNGDQWQRPGKQIKGCPSLQVKNNAQRVKRLLDLSPVFRKLDILVEGLIVFTNTHANLTINNPPVTILAIQQLSSYIKNQKHSHLTKEQIQQIAKQIKNA
jgi:hypothetical protein